jgi:hypothetical protein
MAAVIDGTVRGTVGCMDIYVYGPRADRGQTESDAHRTRRTSTGRTTLCKYVIGDGRSRSSTCTGNVGTRRPFGYNYVTGSQL